MTTLEELKRMREELKRMREEAKRTFRAAYEALARRGGTVFVSDEARSRFEEICESKPHLKCASTPPTEVAQRHWIAG